MPNITLLPLDLTGQAVSNRINNESQVLIQIPGKNNRSFVCSQGAFYSNSLRITDANGYSLKKTDFVTTYIYDELSKMTAQEIMGIVVITNLNVKSPVSVSYQAVGGAFDISVAELKAVFDKLSLDEEHFSFEDIVGKPTAYPPDEHYNKYWQLYGMDSTKVELDRLADAMLVNDKAMLSISTDFYKSYINKAIDAVKQYELAVLAHLSDTNNPHADTQYNLEPPLNKVNNWPMANIQESTNKTVNNKYQPIGGVYRILDLDTLVKLANHTSDINNPHKDTPVLVGVMTKPVANTELNKLLGNTESAANASTIGAETTVEGYPVANTGKTYTQMQFDTRTNLPGENIVSGKFEYRQIGIPPGPNIPAIDVKRYGLTGAGTWRLWSELFAAYNSGKAIIVWAGFHNSAQEALNFINATYGDINQYPANSIAVADFFNWIVTGWSAYNNTGIWQRNINGQWIQIF